jgi:hypothetical protein
MRLIRFISTFVAAVVGTLVAVSPSFGQTQPLPSFADGSC